MIDQTGGSSRRTAGKTEMYSRISMQKMDGVKIITILAAAVVVVLISSSINAAAAVPRFKKIPRLSPTGLGQYYSQFGGEERSDHVDPGGGSGGLKEYMYNQTLDHFNYRSESFNVFQQRYFVDTTHWGGAHSNAPIFVYLGAEESLDIDIPAIGILYDTAPIFKPLILYLEHRYYGKSVPFNSFEQDFNSTNNLGYFDSAQALADYAELILFVKQAYNATDSPVIVTGGSYGGMLAAWFRLKYPHVAMGALASSAPILYFDRITPPEAYYDHVTTDYWAESESCFRTIKRSFSRIDKVASFKSGLSILSQIFRTCQRLQSGDELESYLLAVLSGAAQYDRPPNYPVKQICEAIDGAPSGTDAFTKLAAGIFAYFNDSNHTNCYVNPPNHPPPSQTEIGWSWQVCSDLVIPMATSSKSMFPPDPWDLNGFMQQCQTTYGVPPRPNWVTTYFGGHQINLVLKRFGSNIIFSNGLKDPYSSGGILRNISDTVVAVSTKEGSHCMDILYASESDPDWLVEQRSKEVSIIQGWIAQYYDDLKALLKH